MWRVAVGGWPVMSWRDVVPRQPRQNRVTSIKRHEIFNFGVAGRYGAASETARAAGPRAGRPRSPWHRRRPAHVKHQRIFREVRWCPLVTEIMRFRW